MKKARDLAFGVKGATVKNDKYSDFVDALNEVDRFELVFDIKAVVSLVVDALKKKGTKSSLRWDAHLMSSLRLRNDLMQAQLAVRDNFDSLLRELTVMHRY